MQRNCEFIIGFTLAVSGRHAEGNCPCMQVDGRVVLVADSIRTLRNGSNLFALARAVPFSDAAY